MWSCPPVRSRGSPGQQHEPRSVGARCAASSQQSLPSAAAPTQPAPGCQLTRGLSRAIRPPTDYGVNPVVGPDLRILAWTSQRTLPRMGYPGLGLRACVIFLLLWTRRNTLARGKHHFRTQHRTIDWAINSRRGWWGCLSKRQKWTGQRLFLFNFIICTVFRNTNVAKYKKTLCLQYADLWRYKNNQNWNWKVR